LNQNRLLETMTAQLLEWFDAVADIPSNCHENIETTDIIRTKVMFNIYKKK